MTNVLKIIKTTGMSEKVPIWIHTATDHSVIRPLGLEAPEGVMGTMDYHFYHPDIPQNRDFVKAFQSAYGNPPGFSAFHAFLTAHLIAKAYEKAGNIDREKFIDALEGLKVDSPVGEIEMRACDHQAVLPLYMGTLKKAPQYNFLISSDIVTLPGRDILPACEEVKKIRGGS
jgi:branched-chain amino acid transport system substrate-binding protein